MSGSLRCYALLCVCFYLYEQPASLYVVKVKAVEEIEEKLVALCHFHRNCTAKIEHFFRSAKRISYFFVKEKENRFCDVCFGYKLSRPTRLTFLLYRVNHSDQLGEPFCPNRLTILDALHGQGVKCCVLGRFIPLRLLL